MFLVERYQDDHRMPSLNYAIKVIIESHPAIVQLAQSLYHESATPGGHRES